MSKPTPTKSLPFTPPPKTTSTLEYHEEFAPLTGDPADSPTISSASESEPESESEELENSKSKSKSKRKGKAKAKAKPESPIYTDPSHKKSKSDDFGITTVEDEERKEREEQTPSPTDELLREDDLGSFLAAMEVDRKGREEGVEKKERVKKVWETLDELAAVKERQDKEEDERREREEDQFADEMLRRERDEGKNESDQESGKGESVQKHVRESTDEDESKNVNKDKERDIDDGERKEKLISLSSCKGQNIV